MPMRRGPQGPKREKGYYANAAGVMTIERCRRPLCLYGVGLPGYKAAICPRAKAAGASVVPQRRRPQNPCGREIDNPKTKEAPAPMRRVLRSCQSGAGSRTKVAAALGAWAV